MVASGLQVSGGWQLAGAVCASRTRRGPQSGGHAKIEDDGEALLVASSFGRA